MAPGLDSDLSDYQFVSVLLGRQPRSHFDVVVRGADGIPWVIRNAPLELDGRTPMPTRYWLLGSCPAAVPIGRLEADGGVRQAEAAVDADELARAHARYAADRDAAIPADYDGPRPNGGVGGTRQGVKCLHAHYGYFLVGGDDPVGRWVASRLADTS